MLCPACSHGFQFPHLVKCGWGNCLQCPSCSEYFDLNGNSIEAPANELEPVEIDEDDSDINWIFVGRP